MEKKRGRASSASLMIASRPTDIIERQKPPHNLTDEETEIWVAIVNSEEADWFTPATVPLLRQYCRHVVHTNRIAELIERAANSMQLDDYDRLLKLQERESRICTLLATKMRLTQQSTINKRGHLENTISLKPWEDSDDDC